MTLSLLIHLSLSPPPSTNTPTRAPAAKLDRVFARPFLAAMAHDDGITCLARNPRRLNSLLSGAADGDIRLWDIPAQRCLRRLVGHTGQVGAGEGGALQNQCFVALEIALLQVLRRYVMPICFPRLLSTYLRPHSPHLPN